MIGREVRVGLLEVRHLVALFDLTNGGVDGRDLLESLGDTHATNLAESIVVDTLLLGRVTW